MSRPAPTPGPWRVEHTPYRHVRASDGTQDGWGSTVFAADYSSEADERLIASAPALLEALEKLNAWASRALPATDEATDYLNEGGWDDIHAIVERARAAINLARGAQ